MMPDRHPTSPQKIKARRGKGWCTAILIFLLMLGLFYALYYIREQHKQLIFIHNDRGECFAASRHSKPKLPMSCTEGVVPRSRRGALEWTPASVPIKGCHILCLLQSSASLC